MIRKAIKGDLDGIAKIYENILALEKQGAMSTGWLPGVYPTRSTAEKALERDDLFVYDEGGRVLAAAIINHEQVNVYADGRWKYEAADDEVMVIHTLVVEPSAASKGIGRAFVRFYESYAKKSGCKALRLDTNAKNTAARRFYSKQDYSEAGIVPCVFNGIPNVELVLLEKSID